MVTEYLKNNNLIICPNYLKKKVVEEINNSNKLIQYKVMDLNEFMKNYHFDYDNKTIFYLINKLNLKYDIILEYINSFYYLEDKNYNSNKLNELVTLKKELDDNNLLYYNHNFKYYLKNTSIILYGYNNIDSFYENIFNKFNFQHIKNINTKKLHDVYEFDNIEDEIAYTCHNIKEKLDSGISINKIKLINPASEYIYPLKRIFNWCHIPLEIENKISLYDLDIGKDILKKIENNLTFNEIIDYYEINNIDKDIIDKVISLFNEYVELDINTFKLYKMIEHDLKNTYLKNKSKNNCVKICSLEELDKDEYGYLLGFNKENYPVIYKDEDFLSDKEKEELGILSSNDKNIIEKENLINTLNKDLNLTISYKYKTAFNVYNPSLIIIEEDYNIIKNPNISLNISNNYNRMTLAKELDKFNKYGILSETLKILIPSYETLEYRTYDNSFDGINNSNLLSSLKNPFNLSYSTVDEYYRCSFRYYISNILKIKEVNIDEFYMNIGNIFHYVLSKCFDNDFDFDKYWNEEASKYEFTFEKLILLEKLKNELKYDIEILKKHKTYTSFNESLYEKRFSIPIKNNKNINVNFVGIVDKINYLKDNNRTLVSIIDYKTGTLPSNLNNIIYGIGMQLPIYLYFVKRSNLFPNIEIVGFYLQKIINKDMKATSGKTINELKENALKLVGYSTDNEEILEKFDITYSDSQMISSLKKKKEGFYAYSKILSNKQMNNLDKLVDEKIKEATTNILDGKFDINPKKIDKDIVGCEFCSYRDICFKREENYQELEKHKNLDFLGGDDNA